MKGKVAFRFIPELVGDIGRTRELSKNPNLLYVEAALNTLHMAADVFQTVQEYRNTKRKKKTKEIIQEKYSNLEQTRITHYEEEVLHNIDINYERVKMKVREGKYRDKEVREFITCLKNELHKAIDIFNEMQIEPDYPDRDTVEEVTRRALRDYNKLILIFMGEER